MYQKAKQINTVWFWIVGVLVVLIFYPSKNIIADENNVSIGKSINKSACRLYHSLEKEKGNLFFSPYSISTAMSMAYIGARGKTADEISNALYFPKEVSKTAKWFSILQDKLNEISEVGNIELLSANSMWLQKGFNTLKSFREIIVNDYKAGVFFVDFAGDTEKARKKINDWVSQKTKKKIPELLGKRVLGPTTRLVLCNALYFKGEWYSTFDRERTRKDDFWVTSDKGIKVDMMRKNGWFRYKDFGIFEAVELMYGGEKLSMIIFLPKNTDGISELEKDLTGENLNKWINDVLNGPRKYLTIGLPKFKIGKSFELKKQLQQIGIKTAFGNADFSGIDGKRDLFISAVVHKSIIEVNETGTEAAAATGVVMAKSISFKKSKEFIVNHPFVFVIVEKSTQTVLFMGKIVNPLIIK